MNKIKLFKEIYLIFPTKYYTDIQETLKSVLYFKDENVNYYIIGLFNSKSDYYE